MQTQVFREMADVMAKRGGPAGRENRTRRLCLYRYSNKLRGLMWVKTPHSLDGNSGGQTYHGAIALCNTLDFGGYSDWRLPNVRELQSLIDYGRYYPALPLGHPFIGVQSLNYRSSTTHVGYADRAWFVYLYHGNVSLSVNPNVA